MKEIAIVGVIFTFFFFHTKYLINSVPKVEEGRIITGMMLDFFLSITLICMIIDKCYRKYYIWKNKLITYKEYLLLTDKKKYKLPLCSHCNQPIRYNGSIYYYPISNKKIIRNYCGCMDWDPYDSDY